MINKAKGKKSPLQKGFTLVELLVVVIILGTLSGIALPAFLNQQKKAAANAANAEVIQAARSCAALQVTEEQGSHDSGNATGTCNAAGTASTFTVAAVQNKHTQATAVVDASGGVAQGDVAAPQ